MRWILRATSALALALVACGGDIASNGGFGATPGGVKDMSFARELVANGQVPPPSAFLVEGMFSEHDLPLAGAPCQRTLCLRGALGVADTLDGKSSGWVQIGMSSTIDPNTFQRPPITLIATVDVSGSMGWGGDPDAKYPTPGALSRRLLSKLAATLGPDDRIAIVIYGSDVRVALPITPGDQHATVQQVIDALTTTGSTNMEAGLRTAYDLARQNAGGGRAVRLVLFTDEQPNVGATSATEFEAMVADGARQDIGLTVMGLGLGLGAEVMVAMAHLRGGNAFSLSTNADVDQVMADEWPWLASPIAYDLSLALGPSNGAQLAETYGFPTGTGAGTSLDVATVFLSKRRGALLARLAPTSTGDLSGLGAHGTLAYKTPAGDAVTEPLDLAYQGEPLDERHQFFQQSSVGKAVALALLVSTMRTAAEKYSTDENAATDLLRPAVARFAADQKSLAADDLLPEVEFAKALLALMEQNAPQGDLYGR